MSKLQQIFAIIATMTLKEFHEFVKKFGVSSYGVQDLLDDTFNSPPQVPATATTYGLVDLSLWESGIHGKKIQAIKLLREHRGWGLKDSKDEIDRVCNSFGQCVIGSYPPYLATHIVNHWAESGITLSASTTPDEFQN